MTSALVRRGRRGRTKLVLAATIGVLAGAMSLAAASPAAAQTGAITGTITSTQTGEPLSAAQVSVEGTGLGALTQSNGKFLILRVPPGTYTVNAVLIGFASQSTQVTVSAGESAVADMRLEPQAISLSEIVVTGVAGATQRTKLPFDVAQVKGSDIEVPTVNVGSVAVGQGGGRDGGAGLGSPGLGSVDPAARPDEPGRLGP